MERENESHHGAIPKIQTENVLEEPNIENRNSGPSCLQYIVFFALIFVLLPFLSLNPLLVWPTLLILFLFRNQKQRTKLKTALTSYISAITSQIKAFFRWLGRPVRKLFSAASFAWLKVKSSENGTNQKKQPIFLLCAVITAIFVIIGIMQRSNNGANLSNISTAAVASASAYRLVLVSTPPAVGTTVDDEAGVGVSSTRGSRAPFHDILSILFYIENEIILDNIETQIADVLIDGEPELVGAVVGYDIGDEQSTVVEEGYYNYVITVQVEEKNGNKYLSESESTRCIYIEDNSRLKIRPLDRGYPGWKWILEDNIDNFIVGAKLEPGEISKIVHIDFHSSLGYEPQSIILELDSDTPYASVNRLFNKYDDLYGYEISLVIGYEDGTKYESHEALLDLETAIKNDGFYVVTGDQKTEPILELASCVDYSIPATGR